MTLFFPEARTRRAPGLESTFVTAAVALLSFLALADRVTAWLIGEFPASAALWQLRFEFLRPIGVYYDFAVLCLGRVSSASFCLMAAVAALAVAVGVLSRIRLLRAMSCHALLGCAAMLWACSLTYHEGVYAPAGVPSSGYALFGALLALPAAILCLGIHAEYVGWSPANSIAMRRSRIAVRRMRRRADGALSDLLDSFGAASGARQIALAPLRIVSRARFRR
jgi:hypothetical protein